MEVTSLVSDTYFSFFLSHSLWDVWTLFLLGLARIVPIIALAPFLGGKILPNPIKLGFGVALIPIFLPYLLANATVSLIIDINFFLLMIKEVLIGSILGFVITVPFYFSQAAGTLIDHQRGAQSLQVTDPSSQVQASPTGLLYNNLMIVIFFAAGGPLLFFNAIITSYQIIPADQFLNPSFFSQSDPMWNIFIKLINSIVSIALQLAAPALISLLMTDLFLGIANRMAPQVQITFLLWSLKAFIGIAALWAAWWLILKQMDVLGLSWVKTVTHFIENWAPS